MTQLSSSPLAAQHSQDVTTQPLTGAEVIEETPLETFLQYWESRCEDGFPMRRDIDPIDIPRLLSRLMLVDVQNGGLSFGIRLAGTWLNTVYGHELTGTAIEAGSDHGGSDSIMRQLLGHAYRHRAPAYAGGYWLSARGLWLEGRGVAAPLSDDGATVTGIVMCLSDFTYASHEKPIESASSFTMVLGSPGLPAKPQGGR